MEFLSAAALEDWLISNHASSSGFWLRLKKNAAGEDVLTYAQALDVALCYGWIDARKGKLDDAYWLQRFTPRTARSKWSKVNREKATALIEQGWSVPDAQGNFVWLALGRDSIAFAAACDEVGVSVRPFDGDGVRVTIGEPEANDVFLGVTKTWLAERVVG